MPDATISAFLRIDLPEERTTYPQVGLASDSSLPSVQAVYWRTAAVFYASSRRANPEARHLLFTNAEPPSVDGFDLGQVFDHLGVELIDVPFTYRPPKGYWELWGNQFYILDLIDYFSTRPDHFPVLIFDIDCIFIAPGDRLIETVERVGIGNYVVEEINADPTFASNGLTTVQLQEISEEIAGHSLPRVHYCGGEIFGATHQVANEVSQAASDLWQICLDRHDRGLRKLNTEEHFFSYLYTAMELPVGTANRLIRRIWTQRTYRNTAEGDLGLVVWHLPAEKKYGFRRLFAEATDSSSLFWQLPLDVRFRRHVGSRLGVPSATITKRLLDAQTAARERWKSMRT